VERLLKGVLERLAPEAPRRAELLHQVFDLISGKVGSFVEVGPVRVSRERTVLRFEHGRSTEQDPEWLIELVPGTSVQTPRGIIRVDILAAVPEARQTATEHVVLVDARVLDERLTVGIWREGDRIRPMGMNGHSKKISDYLTDRKVETTRRRLVPAVRSGDDVIWLAGVGLSHDARLRSDSRGAVLMVFVPMDVPVTS